MDELLQDGGAVFKMCHAVYEICRIPSDITSSFTLKYHSLLKLLSNRCLIVVVVVMKGSREMSSQVRFINQFPLWEYAASII